MASEHWWEKQSLLPLKPCSSLIISGSTGAGKTTFLLRLLQHLHGIYVEDAPSHVLYCYGIYQPLYEEFERLPYVTLHKGLLTVEELDDFTSDRQHKVVVLDDLMQKVIKSDEMELLFTQGCHHRRISVIFVTQNLLPQGKNSRTIALNAWYLCILKNLRAASQIAYLGRQIFPHHPKFLLESYEDTIKTPFNYLFVDLSPHAEDKYRVRSKIFPGENTEIYQPKV